MFLGVHRPYGDTTDTQQRLRGLASQSGSNARGDEDAREADPRAWGGGRSRPAPRSWIRTPYRASPTDAGGSFLAGHPPDVPREVPAEGEGERRGTDAKRCALKVSPYV